jgi:multicomponent Na+:H+ antiporter subunit F
VAELLAAVALFLLLNVLAGLVRIWRGPTPADRMLSVQLFGSTGTATLLLLAEGEGAGALRDVALVVALLASVVTVAFVRGVGRSGEEGGQPRQGRQGPAGGAR